MPNYLPGLNFPIYSGWTQYTPVIPKFYWDVYSAEQRMKQLCLNFDKVEHYLDFVSEYLNQWGIEFTEEMNNEFAEMWQRINDGFEDEFSTWFAANIDRYIVRAISQIYFGLTLDGYFVAYIPDSWDEITFDTGAVYNNDDYGRLKLIYYVDSPHEVEQ